MVSSASNYRARVVGIVGGFYAVSMVVKIIGRMAPGWEWFSYFSFFTPFEPQLLVADPARAWTFWTRAADGTLVAGGLGYDSILIGLGLACYIAASVVFCRRDLPAPL
jgi:ABC-2 type transport system permease protein